MKKNTNGKMVFSQVNPGSGMKQSNEGNVSNLNTRLSYDFINKRPKLFNPNSNKLTTSTVFQRFNSVERAQSRDKHQKNDHQKLGGEKYFRSVDTQKIGIIMGNGEKTFQRFEKPVIKSRKSYAMKSMINQNNNNKEDPRNRNRSRDQNMSLGLSLSNNFKNLTNNSKKIQRKLMSVNGFREQKIDMKNYVPQGYSSHRNEEQSPKLARKLMAKTRKSNTDKIFATTLSKTEDKITTNYIQSLQDNFKCHKRAKSKPKETSLHNSYSNILKKYSSKSTRMTEGMHPKLEMKQSHHLTKKKERIVSVFDSGHTAKKIPGHYLNFEESSIQPPTQKKPNRSRMSPRSHHMQKRLKFPSSKKLNLKSRSSSPMMRQNKVTLTDKRKKNKRIEFNFEDDQLSPVKSKNIFFQFFQFVLTFFSEHENPHQQKILPIQRKRSQA